MMHKAAIVLLTGFALFCAAPATAQDTAPEPGPAETRIEATHKREVKPPVPVDTPLEITADDALEWDRTAQKFTARGNAVAAQGTMSVSAAVLTADYKQGADGSTEVWRLTAENGVKLDNGGNVATGDRAVYNLDKGLATLSGGNLRMQSTKGSSLTAQERFEYDVRADRLTAIGKPVLIQKEDRIEADTMTATFHTDATGNKALDKAEAHGNVVITTPTEIITGNQGVYRATDNTVELSGAVKVTRGLDKLEGSRAEVDLTTNISTMYGAEATETASGEKKDGRVRGVFYPSKKP